jgi:hypothetical protein
MAKSPKTMIVATVIASIGLVLLGAQDVFAQGQTQTQAAHRVNPYETPPDENGGCRQGNLVNRGGRDVCVVCPQSLPYSEAQGMCMSCPPYWTLNANAGTCTK